MVKIRLTRLGRHKLPYFRIVAIDSRSRRDGDYIKLLGTYEPFEGKVELLEQEILYFLNQGAQPSDTVRSMLKDKGIWKKFTDAKLKTKIENKKNKPNKKVSVSKKVNSAPAKQVAKKPITNKKSAKPNKK